MKSKYLLFYVIPILIAVSLVLIIRFTTRPSGRIAGYPICPDTGKNVTLDVVTNPQVKIPTHPRCWSGWISFSQSNFNWSANHGTRALEYYFQNGVREAGAANGENYTLKKYPGGAFRLRGEEGVTIITLVDPRAVPKAADNPGGAKWGTRPAPLPPPAKIQPLPSPPPEPRGATYQPLPPEHPKREHGAVSVQPVPPAPQRDSGAASVQPLPSSSPAER